MKILQSVFRLYVSHEAFEKTVSFYERIQNQCCERRVLIAETGVTAAKDCGSLSHLCRQRGSPCACPSRRCDLLCQFAR